MAVITISRQTGALGDEIAKAVAEELHYNYVDKTQISDAMADQGLSFPEFEKFDGKKPTIWQSMTNQKKKFIYLLRAAVYHFAGSGNAVILGRGGQALLKDIPATLHVRIFAPMETRLKRLMDREGYTQKQAGQVIAKCDRDSSGYIRSFFDIDWDDENMYDLLLNTRTMTVGSAVSLIASAMDAPDFKAGLKGFKKNLEDLALTQKAMGILVGFPGVDLTHLEVLQGVLLLSGLARSRSQIEACVKILAEIKGIKEVRSNLEVATLAGV